MFFSKQPLHHLVVLKHTER